MLYMDLANDGRSQFYIDFKLQINIFTISTGSLQICNNAVLLPLLLLSYSAVTGLIFRMFLLNN